jgi:peptidoglycan/LPS O-acetylase OafA/YrhL
MNEENNMNVQSSKSSIPHLLTRAECSALRGLAIAGIVLHNYCHWLDPIVKENEYTFEWANLRKLTRVMLSPDINLPVHLLSFFGHYGVAVFLFLSAFGLVMKYEKNEDRRMNNEVFPSTHSSSSTLNSYLFIKKHFLKLFRMMFVGFVIFTMVDEITPSPFSYKVWGIFAQLGMVNNLIPHPDKVIWPGPYWFFGLMLQLYIVYRLLLYKRHWGYTVALIAVCWVVQSFCKPESETLNYLRYNFVGGILPFGAGLLYAHFGRDLNKASYATIAILSFFMIFFFSYYYQLWFTIPLIACAFSIALVKLLPKDLNQWLAWLGSISAALFVCHPITRKIFIPISKQGDIYTGLLLYIITSIAVAAFVHRMIDKLSTKKQN